MRSFTAYIAAAAALLLTACASIGRPEGGPRDELPPEFVRANPAPGTTGFDSRTINLTFNENVQLEDAFNRVVVSPVQKEAVQVSANGRNVRVVLRDTLVPDMTYTIDFGDAIKDLNEGNVLDGFAIDFSTGESIDSLRIAGRVLGAENLEPAQGILVAAYSNLADSAIRTTAPDRIARTNQRGLFTLRNLADRPYRIYALNDVNRDWHWDRSEDVAFLDTVIHPYVQTITVTDTLYDSARADSLIERSGRRFMPNDVLLNVFNQRYRAQYLKDYSRPERRRVQIVLGAPADSLPQIRPVGGPMDGRDFSHWARAEHFATNDSVILWLADSSIVACDSLMLSVRYQKPDSLDVLQWTTDTLRFFYREPRLSKKERQAAEADTMPPRRDILAIKLKSTTQEVYEPLQFTLSEPVASLDTAAMHLSMQVDTTWVDVALPEIRYDSLVPLLGRSIDIKWEPGAKYKLTIDSAAVVNLYGEHNPPFESQFTVRKLEDYGNLTFRLRNADSTAVVQLLNASDAVQRSARAVDGEAVFRYLMPGTYYARMFFDADGDGLWSTGLLDSIQPEEVAYYPKKIDLKRNWDISQDWDIYELPVDQQKPYAILKNKPKLKRGEQAPVDEEEEDEDPLLGGSGTSRRSSGKLNTGSLGGRRQGDTGNTTIR